jgi:hypothetical protein
MREGNIMRIEVVPALLVSWVLAFGCTSRSDCVDWLSGKWVAGQVVVEFSDDLTRLTVTTLPSTVPLIESRIELLECRTEYALFQSESGGQPMAIFDDAHQRMTFWSEGKLAVDLKKVPARYRYRIPLLGPLAE